MLWSLPTKLAFFLTGLLAALFLAGWIYYLQNTWEETKIVFLSVGQGDAILITHGSHQVLIDGGREGKRLLSHMGKHVPFYDREIEAIIETHPDADHIGDLPDVLERYRVRYFLQTGAKSDTDTVRLLDRALQASEETEILPAFAGTRLEIGDGKLEVVFPFAPVPQNVEDTNDTSVVSRFTFGKTSFLLTGDLASEEEYLPQMAPADVLKAAHHGSRYSTSDAWLNLVKPRDAIISVGTNTYGHPSPDVMKRLTDRGVNIYRTDELGDIVYRCRKEWEGCQREK